ncbi:MAG: protein translocase subunit SecDF [Bacteroidetes bacterium]|jgi:SecD/SecF fusion protein|nr:protein translocase subunit SecDF [Bacteroidota bacterium]MDF1863311.1 protein translocase subunit SecDF [Saprospiraceae bacterium]
MQGKGVVKFFLIVMTIVTLVQFLFNFPTRKVEKAADEFANNACQNMSEEDQKACFNSQRASYLDSMSSETVFSIPLLKDYTYQELKGQQLALGLDLKGGMSVVLQVDLREFIRALANDSKDPTFEKALDLASERLKEAQSDYVSLFGDAWSEEANGKTLASIFRKNNSLSEQVNAQTSDGEVVRVIREQATETVQRTFELLKKRIDKLGVAQPNVSLDEARDLILVELPGIDNPERARAFLSAAAKLEFWKIYRTTDQNPSIIQALIAVNDKLKSLDGGGQVDTREILSIDTTFATDDQGNIDNSQVVSVDTQFIDNPTTTGPLFDLFQINGGNLSPSMLGMAEANKRKAIDAMLARDEVKDLIPSSCKLLWSRNPEDYNTTDEDETEYYVLYAIQKERNSSTAPLEGDEVSDATSNPDPTTGEMQVALNFNQKGAQTWGRLTQEAYNDNNRELAIVLDDEVVSAPSVRSPILNGRSSITGNFSVQEAEDLASILKIGKLPANLESIQESIVGPSLGAENINRSVTSMVGGFLLVLAFMVFYYGGAGIVSIIALFMNLFFIFGALASYGTVLTLPGIAGIILTIGMAVDANVIIYERIREELREGKSLRMAIQDGFQNSYSAIIDANVTTILVAMVLAKFGLGPIKGFAVVLIIGVLASLFTAVLVGRLMIDWWTSKDRNLTFWTPPSRNAFANLDIDWLGKRKVAYMVSGAIILAGLGSMFTRGFDLGVDFKGGYSYNIQFVGDAPNAETIRTTLTGVFDGKTPVVKAVDSQNTYNVVTDYLVDSSEDDAAEQVMSKLHEGINSIAGTNVSLDAFKNPDGIGTHVESSSKVGPTIADDIKTSSYYATIFSLLLIFLYIFIRFSKWQYSAGAVAALFHDVLVVMGIFSIFHGILGFSMEIDQPFIAAILTVIGYSINDTVVVFDRIREFMGVYTGKSKEEIINKAINSTVSRTVITSVTTMFVVLILFLFGGGSIKGFAFALLIGIIVGTYSSIFVATPVMSDLSGELKAKEVKKSKKSSFSRRASEAK